MPDLNTELERIERGEAWDESDEVVEVEVKRPLDKVIPVRLPAAKWEKLRKEARELGVGPTTLARMWILERMRIRSISPQGVFRFTQLLGTSAFIEDRSLLLTPRETEVLELITHGCITEELSERLNVSEAVIKNHMKNILEKLNPQRGIVAHTKSNRET